MMYARCMMIRTQIYLPKSLKDYYQDLARKNNTSLAGEIRSALEELKRDQRKSEIKRKSSTNKGDRLLKMAKEIAKIPATEKTPSDLSVNMDKYLYDGK